VNQLIILDNKKCKLVLDDESLMKRVHRHLSFKPKGIEFSPAFQNGWSGITYLMTKSGTFDLGLLLYVKDFLSEEQLEIIDNRPSRILSKPLDIYPALKKIGQVPRDYQEAAVEALVAVDRGIVRAATASGKTTLCALTVAKLNKPTIVYVIGLDLLGQFHKLFSSLFDEPIGFVGNNVCDIQRINIVSVWTAAAALGTPIKQEEGDDELSPSQENAKKIKEMLRTTEVSIIDECHMAACESIQSIYKFSNNQRIYGLSGTPYRDDGSDLLVKSILGEIVINITASELIAKGILAQPMIKFIPVPKVSGLPKDYQSIYKEYVVENDTRNNLIISNLKSLIDKGYKPLVLFRTIQHGEVLFELIKQCGISCEMLSGKDSLDQRNRVKYKIESGEISCILASTIFDIGVDIPILSALVLAGPNKGRIKTYQRIGRVIRAFPGKKIAAVVDFFDQCKYLKDHSFARCGAYAAEPGFKVIRCNEMK
jgi:superfamily II DNA or RNA helicase